MVVSNPFFDHLACFWPGYELDIDASVRGDHANSDISTDGAARLVWRGVRNPMTDEVRVEPLTPLQILGLRGELVIDAARRIRGVKEWRNRDSAGPGVVVEAMADVVRLAEALDDYDEALGVFHGK